MNSPDDALHEERKLRKFIYENIGAELFDRHRFTQYRTSTDQLASSLAILECFAEDILRNDEKPFTKIINDRGQRQFLASFNWRRYFGWMSSFLKVIDALSNQFIYSEHVEEFSKYCQTAGLNDGQINWDSHRGIVHDFGGDRDPPDFAIAAEAFNQLVFDLRKVYRSKSVRDKINQRRFQVKRTYFDYVSYTNRIMDGRKRIVVIRLDLCFNKEHAHHIGLVDAYAYLDKFLAAKRYNRVLKDLDGFIVKTEYGIEKGIHFHVILFFNGHLRYGHGHVSIAKKIGEYWKTEVTGGKGEYWNCNNEAAKYDRLGIRGIGLIERDDVAARKNLIKFVVTYLCKTEQYFRPNFKTVSNNGVEIMRRPKLIRRGL